MMLVENLYPTVTAQDVRERFRECGTIKQVRLIHDSDGQFCNQATIVFSCHQEFAKAFCWNQGTMFGGRKLGLRY